MRLITSAALFFISVSAFGVAKIQNGDIKSNAAISRSKLASGTAFNVIANNSGGVMSSVASNTTTTRKFLRQTGTGSAATAAAWDTILSTDISGLSTTSAAPTYFAMTGGVAIGWMEGPDVAEDGKTVSKILCSMRNSGSSGSTTIKFRYGAALASNTTLSVTANGGLANNSVSTPGVVLSSGEYIDAEVTAVASGSPTDLRCKVLY